LQDRVLVVSLNSANVAFTENATKVPMVAWGQTGLPQMIVGLKFNPSLESRLNRAQAVAESAEGP